MEYDVQQRAKIIRFLLIGAAMISLAGCDFFTSPEARLERAREQVESANYRGALVELKNALQKNPDLHGARLLLAEVALWLGDANSADVEVKRVPPAEDPAAIADLQTRIDLALGRHKAALDRVEQFDDHFDPAARALYRGQALLGLREPRDAEAAFASALEHNPQLIGARVGMTESIAAQGDDSRALEVSSRLVEEHADSAEAWLGHGALLTRSDPEAAQEAIDRAHSLGAKQLDVPQQIAVLSTLTDLRLARGLVDDARESSEMLTRLAPGAPISSLMSSRVAMASNDYATAAAELRRIVNAAPQFVQARFMLGAALSAQGNLEQASHELNRVVREAPQLVEARQLLARVRMRLDDPDGALQVLVPALQAEGEASGVISMFDAVRAQAGSSPRTVELLERELATSPDNAALITQLASAYLQADQAERALALLEDSPHGTAVDPRREALLLASILEARGASRARQHADKLIAEYSSNSQIVGMVAAFHGRLGDIDAARALIKAALERMPDSPDLLIALARIEWEARRPDDARAVLRALISSDEGHAGARFALAELELATGRTAAAQEQLEYLRKHTEHSVAPLLMLARIALAKDEGARANELIAEALDIENGANEAALRAAAGGLYLEHGRYDQAIAQFRAAVELEPGAAATWLNLGRAQLALNQRDAARDSFAQALEARPNWLAAEGALAFLDLQAGDRSSALQRIAALKSRRPRDAEVSVLEGQVHASLRQYREASAAFDAAAELELTGNTALYAFQVRQAGRLPNPTEPLERWIQRHPEDLRFRSLLADAYTRAGERREAIEQYQFILARQPDHPASLNNLAWLYYEMKDDRAVELARRASAALPDSAAIADTLGWILVETGHVSEGLPILERAVTLNADPEISYHYAVALIRSGAERQGRDRLEQLLSDHPTFPSRAAAEQAYGRLDNSAAVAPP